MLDAGAYYGIMISIIFIIFIGALFVSMHRHRRDIKLYSILLREDGRISKVAVAFLFILPVILYQAIYLNEITPGLEYILLTIFGTELGVKFTDRLPDMLNRRKKPPLIYSSDNMHDCDKERERPLTSSKTSSYNPYKDL